MLKIVENFKIWAAISIILILIGVGGFIINGLTLGIDFQGGTKVQIAIGKEYSIEDVRKIVSKYDSQAQVQAITEGNEVSIRSNSINNTQISEMFNEIKTKYQLKDTALVSTNRIEASVSNDLKRSAFIASIVAVIGILIYVTIRFELKSGIAAIIALIHDVLITAAVYAVFQVPVNNSFIAAILTILGYSINDTIVVFDRIRENKRLGKYKDTTTLIDTSITQTMARSINTVLTTLFTITAVYIFGVSSVKEFAFPLIIGIISGCYSSIFIASPLWGLFVKGEKAHA